ncbi:MAG: DsrE family protein [Thermoanaerobaculia bacterium]
MSAGPHRRRESRSTSTLAAQSEPPLTHREEAMFVLMILNDAPYGIERVYNGLRLAGSLARKGVPLRLFLMGDAAVAAKAGQKVPQGYYSVEGMVSAVVRHGGEVAVCGTCLDARGIGESELMAGARRGTLDELTVWVVEAGKVLTF